MSNPVNGIGGVAAYNWNRPATAVNRPAVTAGGQTFAQIAAGLGIDPQTFDAGTTTGGTDADGAGAQGSPGSTGTNGPTSGTNGGSGTTGPSGVDQAGGSAGQSGSTSGVSSGVGNTGSSGAADPTGASSAATTGDTSGIGATGADGATGSTGAAGSSGTGTIADLSGTDTFLKLLVAQLKNQDPTSPMDDQAFVTELAQFNTVEQMINLKQSIDTQTTSQQASEGIGLLGRTISYATTAVGSNNTVTSQGLVTGVSLVGGQVELKIGTQQVALSAVTEVTP